ncbi:hypothetical protein VXS06_14645 [Photobacterium toruni]|uniref:Uncharacterized protein n=1 Tax=Photobacterium toruni TaxID=1935446 RepID=A0ABU6L8U1_9GAMM|nr:hypothetical protein [Photobacterium toruni]
MYENELIVLDGVCSKRISAVLAIAGSITLPLSNKDAKILKGLRPVLISDDECQSLSGIGYKNSIGRGNKSQRKRNRKNRWR